MEVALADRSMFAVSVAIGVSQYIIKPLLDFLDGPAAARCPVTRMAVLSTVLTLVVASYVGVILFHAHFGPRAAVPLSPANLRRSACVFFGTVFGLIFAVAVPLMGVLLYAADGR